MRKHRNIPCLGTLDEKTEINTVDAKNLYFCKSDAIL